MPLGGVHPITQNCRDGFQPIAVVSRFSHRICMSDDETCVCDEHGVQPMTYVCKHITSVPHGSTNGFVSGPPEREDDLRDAWCDECHSFLKTHGGRWLDGSVEVPDGITIICAECYREREADALRAGRRMIYRAS